MIVSMGLVLCSALACSLPSYLPQQRVPSCPIIPVKDSNVEGEMGTTLGLVFEIYQFSLYKLNFGNPWLPKDWMHPAWLLEVELMTNWVDFEG